MKTHYDVHHLNMRDAQIHIGNCKSKNVSNSDSWEDYESEPVIDSVCAEDEEEAIKLVSKSHNIDKSNLYATKHVANTSGYVKVNGNSHQFYFEASAYYDGSKTGIIVLLPFWGNLLVFIDQENGALNLVVNEDIDNG